MAAEGSQWKCVTWKGLQQLGFSRCGRGRDRRQAHHRDVLKAVAMNVEKLVAVRLVIAFSLVSVAIAAAQDTGGAPAQSISLTVPAGAPLRLYLIKRVPKRAGAAVEAKLLTLVYAFDREVIPAGTQALGYVSSVRPVSRWERIRAILSGDFTPLHIAQVEFTSIKAADGRAIELHTIASPGLDSLVPLKPPKQRSQNAPSNNSGIVGTAKQKVKDTIDAEVARAKSIPDIVRAPGKKEWLYDYAMSRLPYHPQYLRSRTRFDAELQAPLTFGSEAATRDSLALLGSQPPSGSLVHARLLTPVDSMNSKKDETVEALLEEPLFSSDHKLVLPEGTLVHGSVTMAKHARWFHRGGRLRFAFQSAELAPQAAELLALPATAPKLAQESPPKHTQFETRGTLMAAEGGNSPVKVDSEGSVHATESKTRFIGTAVAALVASRAADNDPIRARGGAITGQSSNVGGRTLGGGMGFGLLGSIAAQSSRTVGKAFGFYGLGWAVYSTVIARGSEVQFDRNAVIDIGFDQRTSTGPSTLKKDGAAAAPK